MIHPEQLPRYLRHIANLYQKVVYRELNVPELNNHFDLLLIIDRCDHQLTQKQLAELMYIDKSSMVSIVNYLFEYEFINIRINPLDRRENFISLAEKGKQAVSKIKKAENSVHKSIFKEIDEEKISALFETLKQIEFKLKNTNTST